MELQEARSRLQGLVNFFKGLEKLEEIVAVAEAAEQLQKERTSACEAVGRKLEEAKSQFEAESKRHKDTLAEIKQQVAYAQKKHADVMSTLAKELEAAQAQTVAQIAVARTKQADAEAECQLAIDFMQQRKAVLEKDIKNLESALDKLKAKVGAL